jgi:hypothetical protein
VEACSACEEGPEEGEEEEGCLECSYNEAEEGEVLEDGVLGDEAANQLSYHIRYINIMSYFKGGKLYSEGLVTSLFLRSLIQLIR